MADTDTLDDQSENDSPVLKELRAKAKKADELAESNARMARELALMKSGIDADHPLGRYFVETYTGDPADVDKLTETAKALGVPFKGDAASPTAPAEPAASAEPSEPTGTEERQALANGAPADTGQTPDPRLVSRDLAQTAMQEGASWEHAAGGMINHLAQAAMAGDPRVIVPG